MDAEMITKQEAKEIAAAAAKQALCDFFLSLDIDPDDRATVIALRNDLGYMREQRLANEEARKFVKKTVYYGLVPTGILGILSWAFGVFKGGLHDAIVQWLQKGQ